MGDYKILDYCLITGLLHLFLSMKQQNLIQGEPALCADISSVFVI